MKTKTIQLTFLVLVTLAVAGYFAYLQLEGVDDGSSTGEISTVEQPANQEPSTATKDDQTSDDDTSNEIPTKENPQESDNETSPQTINIASTEIANGKLIVKTNLGKVNNGTCTLTAKNGSKTHSVEAGVLYAPDFSTCLGFSVSLDDLGSGEWSLDLSVVNGESTYDSPTVTVSIP